MCKGNTVFKDLYLRMLQQQSLLDVHNCQFHSGVMAGICLQCVNASIDKGVHVCSYTLIFLHTNKEFSLSRNTKLIYQIATPRHASHKFGNQPTTSIRHVATADWATHYKRQQSTSWLDGRLQEHRKRKIKH